MRTFVATFRGSFAVAGGGDDDAAIWSLLRRFQILEFDFESTAPLARTHALALARQVLADEDVTRAEALWTSLIELSIATARTGGAIDRDGLRAELVKRGFRLAGDRDYRSARERLADMARMTLAGIGTTVAGVHLTRLESLAALDQALDGHRLIELRGGPGVGKSSVLRQIAARFTRTASVIVLDPLSTPGGGWLAFAQALNIPGSARDFLNDLAISGGAVIIIDSLEMFGDPARQRTVTELLREAGALGGFTVIATARAGSADVSASWLADDVIEAFGGVGAVEIGELNDTEIEFLIERAPELRAILAPGHPAAQIARNLYRLSRLLKAPANADIRTEAALASHWWTTADNAPAGSVRQAQRILADLAEETLAGAPEIQLREDSQGRDHLLGSLTLAEVRRDRLGFYHDVLRDWGIGSFIDEDHGRLSGLDMSSPVSARVGRGVEFAARLALETGDDCDEWLDLLARLSPSGAHGSWRRQALLAIVRSEVAFELLERCSAALLAHGAALFVELTTAIAAAETVATADLYAAANVDIGTPIPKSLRTDTTGSGVQLLRWVLQHPQEIPLEAIGAVSDLIQIQLALLMTVPTFAEPSAEMVFGWLRQLDVQEAATTMPEGGGARRLNGNARRHLIEELRTLALLLSPHAPEEAKRYLREIASERNSYKVKAIRPLSATLAAVAPVELSALITSSLYVAGARDREILDGRAFSYVDSDYMPPSPAQTPFFDLLTRSPQHGLALVRGLVSAAVEHHSHGATSGEDGYTLVFGGEPRFFPCTSTYLWPRGQAREYSVTSGLMAIEAWGHSRIDAGEPIDVVIADILGPLDSCAAYLLVAVDLLISHFPVTREALAPFLANPQLLAADRQRGSLDQMESHRQIIGDEPPGRVKLADLRSRPSRRATLEDMLPAYLDDDPVAESLRERLKIAVGGARPVPGERRFRRSRLHGSVRLEPPRSSELDGLRRWTSVPITARRGRPP